MKKAFRLALEAAGDLREIWRYIAADNVQAAKRFRLKLLGACWQLGMNPGIGHKREDLTDQALLFWPVGSYLIIYRASVGQLRLSPLPTGLAIFQGSCGGESLRRSCVKQPPDYSTLGIPPNCDCPYLQRAPQ